jgi:hypothetical protein
METWLFVLGLVIIFLVSAIIYYRPSASLQEDQPPPAERKVADIIQVHDISGNKISKDASGVPVDASGTPIWLNENQKARDTKVLFLEDNIQKPYTQTPIQNVDDYEYSMIFKNEGDRAMTKKTRDFLISQYPKDWSVQPPSSDLFQQGLQAYNEGFEDATRPPTKRYDSINGTAMAPPDQAAQERREQEILNTYVPKDPQSLTTYSADDAKTLIEKIYTAKGLKATYKQTGDNQFQIISTTPLDKVITYEDDPAAPLEAPTSQGPVAAAGEETIVVPEIYPTGGLDPFYTPGEQTRDGRWNYTQFTPGLERMFAPTEPMSKWY